MPKSAKQILAQLIKDKTTLHIFLDLSIKHEKPVGTDFKDKLKDKIRHSVKTALRYENRNDPELIATLLGVVSNDPWFEYFLSQELDSQLNAYFVRLLG